MTVAARRAQASALPRVRARVLPPLERQYARATADYFRAMLPRIEPGIRDVLENHVETKAGPTDLELEIYSELRTVSWDQETRILSTKVAPTTLVVDGVARAAAIEDLGGKLVSGGIGLEGSFDLSDRPLREVQGEVATRIRQVTDQSRRRIAKEMADGVTKGLSIEQIVRGVPPGTTNVRGPIPAFRGIAGLVDSWSSTGQAGFAGAVGTVPLRSSRAYLIALTETGNTFNASSLEAYRQSGLVSYVEVLDGPDCGWTSHDDPSLAHGSIRTLEAARAQPLSHPRCQRAFGASIGTSSSRVSPFQGRRPDQVPGATPGLRPDDIQPFRGRQVRTTLPAVSGFGPATTAANLAAREIALEAVAERIRYTATHETAVVVDDLGNVVLDKSEGKAREVGFSPAEVQLMRGQTITHNHPIAYQNDLLHATSLSPDDVYLMLDSRAREIRAVGKGADYRMRVVDDSIYGRLDDVKRAKERADQAVRARYMPDVLRNEREVQDWLRDETYRINREVPSGEKFSAIANAQREAERRLKAGREEPERLHFHRVWEIVVEQFPELEYVRTLRPEKP